MLTNNNYYQDYSYFSFSLYKKFMSCEAAAMAEIRGEYKPACSEAMIVGSYVDAIIFDDMDRFMCEHPEAISSRGPTAGQLKSVYKHADVMVDRCIRDTLFYEYLKGDTQTILTGEIAGVPVKSKLDILHPERIVDLKTVKDFELVWSGGAQTTFIEAWGYDLQGAIYQEMVRQKTGKKLPYYIAAVTKEPEPNIDVIHISDHKLKIKLQEVEYHLPQLHAVLIGISEPFRCEKCDYCKSTKILTEPIELDKFYEDWI